MLHRVVWLCLMNCTQSVCALASPQVGNLEDTCNRQAEYINQLEEYANSVEAANAQLMQQVPYGIHA